jgi:hypothetical protein
MNPYHRSLVTGSIVLGFAWRAFGACPDARFAPEIVVPGGGVVEGIAVADFDGDGRLDVAVTNFLAGSGTPSQVAILLAEGDGRFGAPTRFVVGHGATRIVASDFNRDGAVDVAVLNGNDGDVSVLLGNGRGGLAPETRFPAGGGIATGLALGDFNGDGIADLVVTDLSEGVVVVLLGIGDGSFAAPTPYPVGSFPLLVAVGDLDADGHPDLAVGNNDDSTVSILLGVGDGTFRPQSIVPLTADFLPLSIALSDLDGDGDLDMVVVSALDDTVAVLLGRGDGSFEAPATFDVGRRPIFVAVGDLSSDGHPDLAVGNLDDSTVSILLGRGDGTFGPRTALAVGGAPIPVEIADLNGDGAPDVLAGSTADQAISVLLNQCTGNRPPLARAGADQILECTGDLQAPARLNASGSQDPDSAPGTNDDITRFDWSERESFLATGEEASVSFPLGSHVVALRVTDRDGAEGSDAVSITVRDTTLPEITSIVADPPALPFRQPALVPVSITAVATDVCDAAPTCRIASVTSDRRNGRFDSILSDPGPKTSPARLGVLLRAGGPGAGLRRTFTIHVVCDDAAGNETGGQTTVTVAPRPVRSPHF